MINTHVNTDDDIQIYCAHAVEIASMFTDEMTDLEMDGSLESIQLVEVAIAENRRQLTPNWFQRLRGDKPSQDEIDEMALWYGCYIGDILVKKCGWEWFKDPSHGFVLRNGEQLHQPDVQIRARFMDKNPKSLVDVYCGGKG